MSPSSSRLWVCIAGMAIIASPLFARTWTSADGKFTVEADFVEVNGANVKLKKADGNEITIPMSKLSPKDREFVLAEKRKAKTPASAPATKPEAGPPVDEKMIKAELEKLGCEIRNVGLDPEQPIAVVTFSRTSKTGDVEKALPLLKQIKGLREVQLGGESTDDDLKALTELKHLKEFDGVVSTFSEVTDAGLLQLKALPRLKMINVIGSKKVTPAGVRKAFDAIPTLDRVFLEPDEGIKR